MSEIGYKEFADSEFMYSDNLNINPAYHSKGLACQAPNNSTQQ